MSYDREESFQFCSKINPIGEKMDITLEQLINAMPKAFIPEKAEGIDATILLNITSDKGGQWVVTNKDKKCTVVKGTTLNPKLTLTANSQDLVDIFSGKLDGMKAFMGGKLKLTGDIGLALKLTNLFKVDESLF
jgi:putative sterol carrier protein